MSRRVFILCILFATSVVQVFANSYMARLTANVSGESTGMGTVYVSSNTDNGTSDDYSEQSQQTHASDTKEYLATFYAFAKPLDESYAFAGWSNDEDGSIFSRSNPLIYDIKCSSTGSTINEKIVYAHFVKKALSKITLIAPELGSFSVSDGISNVCSPGTIETQESVTLVATVPEGYKFFGWYSIDANNHKKYFSVSQIGISTFDEDVSVGVEFVPVDSPIFLAEGCKTPFSDLNDALAALHGEGRIVLLDSGMLKAGDYYIPEGVTLLIPFDERRTCYTKEFLPVACEEYAAPFAYKTLTMCDGANIVSDGDISVSAQMYSLPGNGSHSGGAVTGAYGCIKMQKGSSITVNSGGNLYAWGYILGEGKVDVQSGATVCEPFQIALFRGGNAVKAMAASKQLVFPFNQYFIQNVEAPMTIHHGASELVCTSLYADKRIYTTNLFSFIGNNGMFVLDEGTSITKSFDSTRDRQVYHLCGDAQLGKITMSMMGLVFLSDDYVLPLTHNLSIFIDSGTLSINNKHGVALLPGVEMTICKDGCLSIDDTNVYLYDSDQWGNYSCFNTFASIYSPTCSYKRTSLSDASLNVNGCLNVNGGFYTTISGANVFSSQGMGMINYLANAGNETATFQAEQDDRSPVYVEIPITSAQLKNADSTFTQTAAANAGDVYVMRNGIWLLSNNNDDVNKDGIVDIKDVVTLINILEAQTPASPSYDINGDGEVDAKDVEVLKDIILGK